MNVSEDRFPLLYVHLEEQEQRYNVRARTVSRGAAEILSRWPQYLTFVSYTTLIGLLSLLVCFVLSVLILLLVSSDSTNFGPREFFAKKFDGREETYSISNFRLSDIGAPSDFENASFVVDVVSNDRNRRVVACAIESYLMWTKGLVYHVQVLPTQGAADKFDEFTKKYKNYRAVGVVADSFLKDTPFVGLQPRTPSALRFLVKVLIAWNFAGTAMDSNLLTITDPRTLLSPGNESLVLGLVGEDNVLISSKRVCHSFIFDLMKYLARGMNDTQAESVAEVRREFCSLGRNCSTLEVTSEPRLCDSRSVGDECVLARVKDNVTRLENLWNRICPMAKFFSQ